MKYDLAHVSLYRSFQIWTLQCPLEAWIRFWRHLLVRHPKHDHSSSRSPSPRWWNLMGWEKPFTWLFILQYTVVFLHQMFCGDFQFDPGVEELCNIAAGRHLFFILFCFFLLSDCRREANSSRQSRQRRDHSNPLRRPRKPGGTRTTDCTSYTRSVGVFNSYKNKCTNYFDSPSISLHVLFTDLFSFAGDQRPFSVMRDEDSLFSKFFGGFK